MSEVKTYTAKDLQRYHNGELPAAERHALEKAALDDPFLADALEGFAAAPTPESDLNTLQQKLQLRIEKNRKRRSVFYIGNTWMKVAALFILIALGGWAVLLLFNNKAENVNQPLAVKQPVAPVEKSTADSSSLSSRGVLNAAPLAETEKKEEDAIAKRSSTGRKKHAEKNEELPAAASGLVVLQDSTNHLNDFVAQQAAPVAEQKTAATFKKSFADTKDKERSGYARTTDTINNFNITMQRNDEGLQEVVITKDRKQPVRRMTVTIDSLEPAEGWTNFDDYVASHLKEPEELKEKGLKGEVELSFDVNSQGEPVNIAVTQSLCTKCDEEAVRILKEGPKWKNKKKKGKIKIKFPTPQ